MCDYPVRRFADGSPWCCGHEGIWHVGNLAVCVTHAEILTRELLCQIPTFPGLSNEEVIERVLRQGTNTRRRLEQWAWGWTAFARQERRERAEREKAVVYFVTRDGFVKIGTTTNLKKRLSDIARGSSMPGGMTIGPVHLMGTIPGGRSSERALHAKFSHLHIDLEWFLLTDELRDFINGLACNQAA